MVPQYGFRFNPTDQELIEILLHKASSQEMSSLSFITHINIYEHEPHLLHWNESAAVGKDERYYYYKKENESREVAGRGWWKATSHVKKVYVNGNVVGLKRPLTFHRYRDNGTSRSNAIKTNWIMHEYTLHSNPTEWRLCKLKYKGKPSLQEEMENIRQAQNSSSRDDFEAVNYSMAPSNSNEEQNSLLADNNASWVQLPQTSYIDIDDPYINSDQYLELEPIQEQFPALWSWHNFT
ncbi:NAC domain-containing protein 55-like [Euphorbia lathyris]|uniref:NAC domain-containing protein 55-like n=1 Tax=Euphorbia lathyris TaxID=212925 RepID=UPI0033136F45